jgi:NAD(P)H-dependent FMN reductase
MKKVLLVHSSVREGRVADAVEQLVRSQLAEHADIEAATVDFKTLPLPFFDNPKSPADPEFKAEDKNVLQWAEHVANADVVVVLTAEYNHSFTPVIKNAIDWLYKEWNDKPVAFIGYGWVGGARAIKHLRDVFGSNIGAKAIEAEANLRFKQEIDVDGAVLDEASMKSEINKVLSAL